MMTHGSGRGGHRGRRGPTPVGLSVGSVVAALNDLADGRDPLVRKDLVEARERVGTGHVVLALQGLVRARTSQAATGLDVGPYRDAIGQVGTLACRSARNIFVLGDVVDALGPYTDELDTSGDVARLQRAAS